MKTILPLVIFLLFALLNGTANAQDRFVRVGAAEWPPYTLPGLKHGGVIARIIRESFAHGGYKMEIIFRPWKRVLLEGRNGELDAISFSVRNAEREADFLFSDRLFSLGRHFYHLKSKPFSWENLEDLAGLTIGIDLGFSYLPALEQMAAQGTITLREGRHARNSLKRLLTGRVDLYAMSRDYPEYVLHTEFSPEEADLITYHPTPFETPDFFLLFGKNNARAEEFRTAFNNGLAALRAAGLYDRYFTESRRGDYFPDR